jgi:hypothetical protein
VEAGLRGGRRVVLKLPLLIERISLHPTFGPGAFGGSC